jgi:hypothetical protein
MKKSEIQVGGLYVAKVSRQLVTIRVDEIRERNWGPTGQLSYDVTNLRTGRKTTFRSAAKFRSKVTNKFDLVTEEDVQEAIRREKEVPHGV